MQRVAPKRTTHARSEHKCRYVYAEETGSTEGGGVTRELAPAEAREPRQKHPGALLVSAVRRSESLEANGLFVSSQKVIEIQHRQIAQQDEEPGPDQQRPQPQDRKSQVLRMTNESVQAASDLSAP